MSRISAKFEELRRKREGALIAFLTAGDPRPSFTPKLVEIISKHADVVELGIPFSDPIADGPSIQKATDRALREGTTPETVLRIIKQIRRKSETPLVIMTYYNILLKPGVRNFVRRFAAAGIDGIIIPDLPLEESGELLRAANEHGVDLIFLAAPTTPRERLERICKKSSGFLYLVSLLGVTGARKELPSFVRPLISEAKKVSRVPVAVGFGISKPGQVANVIRAGADGAIVGSAFVNIIEKNLKNEKRMLKEIDAFGKELKAATRTS
ncbi:MAG: tryptophan synthase subunit alpha [Methanobacteriota archaeon]